MAGGFITINSAALRGWCATAAKGERIAYARGIELPQPIGMTARGLADDGLITLARSRRSLGDPFEFLAIRLGKPVSEVSRAPLTANAVAKQARRRREQDERGAAAIMMALIVAARGGDFCPSNVQLAEIAKVDSPAYASKLVCALRDEGRIDVELERGTGTRVITIKASGLSTRRGRAAA